MHMRQSNEKCFVFEYEFSLTSGTPFLIILFCPWLQHNKHYSHHNHFEIKGLGGKELKLHVPMPAFQIWYKYMYMSGSCTQPLKPGLNGSMWVSRVNICCNCSYIDYLSVQHQVGSDANATRSHYACL